MRGCIKLRGRRKGMILSGGMKSIRDRKRNRRIEKSSRNKNSSTIKS
jgi:hypothetical protein